MFGQGGTFNPREGASYAVIGSGLVSDLNNQTPPGDFNLEPTHCNDDVGAFDPGNNLPPRCAPTTSAATARRTPGCSAAATARTPSRASSRTSAPTTTPSCASSCRSCRT
ncbi:hypothetical protein [Nannocystis pusilla]|uniref:hypothetical protein n=1 Tax=Nannocystis pusilla TaxID=889268 RepID=UPI003B7B4B9C